MNDPSRSPLGLIVCVLAFVGMATALYFLPTQTPTRSAAIDLHPSVRGDAGNFAETEIVPHPDAPLDPHKNVIWCGTTALAWNEMIGLLHDKLHYVNPNPEAEWLNREEFTKADLDEPSYLAMAGAGKDQITQRIRDALKNKYADAFSPDSVPDASDQNLIAFACLLKNLSFPIPFQEVDPLSFGGKQVSAFGFKPYNAPVFRSQVSVLSYVSYDNFVIRLTLKDDEDQLILAKIPPGKTLQSTIDSAMSLTKTDVDWGLRDDDVLAIPKIDFELAADFAQLQGRLTSGVGIDKVKEDILFKLNQNGAELKAFTTINATLGEAYPAAEHLDLIFDQPFLVLLKRASSPRPYFAMWVGNPTLLVAP